MDALFISQISLEMGFGGGAECVAFELHRALHARLREAWDGYRAEL